MTALGLSLTVMIGFRLRTHSHATKFRPEQISEEPPYTLIKFSIAKPISTSSTIPQALRKQSSLHTRSIQTRSLLTSIIMSDVVLNFLAEWIKAQKPQAPLLKDVSPFYRNLEEALDLRRADHAMFTRTKSTWKQGLSYDFCSNDLLSLGKTSVIRKAFLEELDRNPDFMMYSGGSRLGDGNYNYIEEVENEIAAFHGAETGLIVNSGWEANTAIYTSIPRPGDAIVYDELVHASVHDGMTISLAQCRKQFRHNDVDSMREAIMAVLDTQPQIVDGSRSLLISVESVYSMDGDICPLVDMMDVAREMCPKGNAVFIVDEAHATGIMGPKGAGLVSKLGLEKEIELRIHTCGKALGSTGGE